MKVKKSDLRGKATPQLPINYPGPEPVTFDFELEKQKVENLCKRLADNEVEVRDAVLDELPRYLKEICSQYDASPLSLKEDIKTSQYIGRPEAAGGEKKKKMTRLERLEHRIDLQRKNFSGLEDDELTLLFSKLALGLFFCYWHSDKPLVQHECAAKIARLLHYPTTPDHKVTFLRSVLRVFSKKWTNIDQWRMDKYMSLVRKLMFEFFRFVQHLRTNQEGIKVVQTRLVKPSDAASSEVASRRAKRNRDGEDEKKGVEAAKPTTINETVFDLTLQRCIKVFQEEVVNGTAAGLTMHIADVFLAELLHAKVTHVPLFIALSKGIPVFIMQRGNNIEKRVVDHFFVPVAAGQLAKLDPEEGEEEQEEGEVKVSVQVARELKAICKTCSTAKATSYSIRPIFAECELFMKHFLDQQDAPEKFEPENEKDRRVRLLREIQSAGRSRISREDVVQRKISKKGALVRKARAAGTLKTKGTTRRKKVR